jgi:hypothetical protein
MSVKLMKGLDPNNITFVELQKKNKYPWWENLKRDKDISIQIRRENYIDVYRNGGAIIRNLRYGGEAFAAEIHSEYIPIKKENENKGYVGLTLNTKGVMFKETIKPMDFSQFDKPELKAVKHWIETRYDPKTEKAIQFKFATKDPCIIDTEFQFNKSRIDLVRLDTSTNKIVFIEIKTIGDPWLFSGLEDSDNIFHQLNKYHEIARDNKKVLLIYFEKVLQIKKDLGLSVPLVQKWSDWDVEPYPLLAFGDCPQKWIEGKNTKMIDDKIRTVACGAYYYQNPDTLDLKPKRKHPRRHYFKEKTS